MRSLGQTRPLLAYGVPAAAGLAVGGALAAQGEDPGSAALGGVAAALGARGGLGAARLAGKYAPELAARIQEKAVVPLGNVVGNIGRNLPEGATLRGKAVGRLADVISSAENVAVTPGAQTAVRNVAAGLATPAAAGFAGLGGLAAGAIPEALGVPGFQENQVIDPESPYVTSNTPGARLGVSPSQSTYRYQ